MNDLESQLPQALEHLAGGAPHRPDLAAAARRGVRRRRILVAGPIAAAVAVLLVLGSASGDLVAIVFGDPLTAPPAADHNNKILWAVRGGASGDLVITGHLEGTDRTTTVNTGASPGPSIVDMPAPGCWRLDLRYGDQTDSINIRWAPN